MASKLTLFNQKVTQCCLCPRLVRHREKIAIVKRRSFRHEKYWAKPVPGLGDVSAKIVIVGLAPGAHGANRTGRVFTGDASGDFLFRSLYHAGLASGPTSLNRMDGLKLTATYITCAVRCAPPDNRPSASEREQCRPFLLKEIELLRQARVFLCLGRIACEECTKVLSIRGCKFKHGTEYSLPGGRTLLCSYHVSRQNTQTGRLTEEMFLKILLRTRQLAGMSHLSIGPSLDATPSPSYAYTSVLSVSDLRANG